MKPTTLLIDVLTGYALITSSLADVPIAYSVPRDGRTSLAIYDQDGRMVRTLLTGKPLAKGTECQIVPAVQCQGTSN